jgi:Sulfatase-modifying factor enzyme 1
LAVIDPWLSLAALSIGLAGHPLAVGVDPGPSPACPDDMRLVEGTHYENVAHICLEPREDTKDTHCYRYKQNFSVLEGPVTPIRMCMDRFEAPNHKGADPLVMASYVSATRWCEKRGKRLCSEREWELACEGPHYQPLAYGWGVDFTLCNSNKQWRKVDFNAFGGSKEDADKESKRLWQGAPSGHYATCMSPFGIFDMMGNVEEWVVSRETRQHPGSLMGGFWAKPWTGCRGTNDAHYPNFAFYETGFRCCKDAAPR